MFVSVLRVGIASLLILPAIAAPNPATLPPDQLAKAIKTDTITIPTPGEVFAALAKPGKIDWPSQYRGPMPMTYRNRAQIALNLGGLIADGFIAVEAQDGQQVKNIGTDIIKLAKALRERNIFSRGTVLTNLQKTVTGTCSRKNWKRRKTK